MIDRYISVIDQLLKLCAPPYCAQCKTFLSERSVFCDACAQKIQSIVSHALPLTKKRTMRVFAVSAYQDPVKRLILAKGGSQRLASVQLAQLMGQHIPLEHMSFDYIIPVPLHWTRKSWRGYNQAGVIAQELSRLTGKPVASLVRRIQRTAYQSSFGVKGRFENVKNVFELKKNNTQACIGKSFLLVDDLMTTGATLTAVGRSLTPLNPKNITAAVACRVG